MDILDMLNDYLKTNKTDEQLASEFVTQLNKGQTIDRVAKLYGYSSVKVREILKNTGYTYYSFSQKWKRSNAHQPTEPLQKETKIAEKLAAEFVALLNSNKGQSIEKVADIVKYPPEMITEILNNTGYKYYGFSRKWKRTNPPKNTKEIIASKVISNSNNTSKETGVVKTYYQNEIVLEHIPEIINKLNNGISILEVAVWYKVTEGKLRQFLKSHKYRYDRIFKVWTNLPRKEFLKQLANDLYNGRISLNDINKNGVNINVVEMELINSGFAYKNHPTNIGHNLPKSNHINSNPNVKKHCSETNQIHPLITEELLLKEEMDESLDFLLEEGKNVHSSSIIEQTNNSDSVSELLTKEEIANLKEMINLWKSENNEISSETNSKVEITIYVNQDLLYELTMTSEREGLSRSLIIEKALKSYLKN
ncbi:CopG family transcriptional regulator [Neobacillus drentensis]|uniref:ribbon-helix-helix domain-containing protein n=1 Tax=Neobacillus drentensis TaxID=220684 RepID=UPI002FFF10CF